MSNIPLQYKAIHTGNLLPANTGFVEGDYWIHSGKTATIRGVGEIEAGDWLIYKFDGWVITKVNNNNTDDASKELGWNIQ